MEQILEQTEENQALLAARKPNRNGHVRLTKPPSGHWGPGGRWVESSLPDYLEDHAGECMGVHGLRKSPAMRLQMDARACKPRTARFDLAEIVREQGASCSRNESALRSSQLIRAVEDRAPQQDARRYIAIDTDVSAGGKLTPLRRLRIDPPWAMAEALGVV